MNNAVIPSVLVAAAFATTSNAVTIQAGFESSTSATVVNSTADLDLAGDFVYALNFTGGGGINTSNPLEAVGTITVGGLVFTNYNPNNAADQAEAPGFTASGAGFQFNDVPGTTGDAGLDTLLDGTQWLTTSANSQPNDYTITGLTAGTEYKAQFIFSENFYSDGSRPADFIVNGTTVIDDYSTAVVNGGRGNAVITYTFVADANPITFDINPQAGGDANILVRGFTLEAVPSPGAASLLAVAGIAAARRRRA